MNYMTAKFSDPFKSLEKIFDNHLSSAFRNDVLTPDIEIKENDDNLIVRAELPGLTKEDISIELKDSVLTLSGEKKIEQTKEGEKFHRTEIAYGSFCRSFHVPLNVDMDNISAKFKDGILNIEIPKSEEAKPKVIEVD